MDEVSTDKLSVTIKALKLNEKKMTQTVFKQLPDKDIIDEKLQLNGKVWGKVNYQLPKQKPSETNIVWQDGNSLYRCSIKPLFYTAEQACRKYQENDWEFNLSKELPHKSLVNAIQKKPFPGIQETQSLFDEYEAVYRSLLDSEQLFIAT